MTNKNIKLPSGWMDFEPIKMTIKKHKRPEMTTLKRDNGTNYKIVLKYINGHALAEMHRS